MLTEATPTTRWVQILQHTWGEPFVYVGSAMGVGGVQWLLEIQTLIEGGSELRGC